MRWIQHTKGKAKRGEVDPPAGDLFFVDEKGSMALVNGVLYIDGKPAPPGKHEIRLKDGDLLPFDVATKGKATRRAVVKGGRKNG